MTRSIAEAIKKL